MTPQPETKPKRVQRKRTKGYRLPANTICVTRPGKWGNPYTVKRAKGGLVTIIKSAWVTIWVVLKHGEEIGLRFDRKEGALSCVVKLFEFDMRNQLIADPRLLDDLRGKNLACWCAAGAPCHADVLLELANR